MREMWQALGWGPIRMAKNPMTDGYRIPDPRMTSENRERRVGVELEFAGLAPAAIAQIVHALHGGRVQQQSGFQVQVVGSDIGDIEVELDAQWAQRLHEGLSQEPGSDDALATIGRQINDAFEALAQKVIPCEVVLPPLPVSQLARIEPLVARLREAGALGTRQSIAYAFGLQFNPEVPSLEAGTILRYLQAFLCLCDWLKVEEQIPVQRKLLPFIHDFPRDYTLQVLEDAYQPGLLPLIDDYLAANATRNRILDMLPLFAHIDEPRVRKAVGTQKVNPRPTFHYRLPNSDIDQPGWSPSAAWNRWVEVESLANDLPRLAVCRRAYIDHHRLLSLNLTPWHEKVQQWLADRAR
jgi:hypothetical protein